MHDGRMEDDGEFYWHVSEEKFLERLKPRSYIEAALIHGQQVSGSHIGEYERVGREGKIAIKDVTPGGAVKFHEYNDQALFVFVLPPGFEDWIARLKKRSHMSEEELRRRLTSAKVEIETALNTDFYRFIISGDLSTNTQMLHDFAMGRSEPSTDQTDARNHAEQLLIDIRLYLDS
jgi:guanylate kinase